MIKNNWIVILIILLGPGYLYAQQKPVFSQYYFNPLAINPSFAGSQNDFSTSALYRNQWVNLEGSPKLITFTANTSLKTRPIGLGFVLSNETIGVHSDFSLYFSYAYRIKFKFGTLSMGLQAGFTQLQSDFSKLTLVNPNDPDLSGIFSKFNPNFGAGVFFERSNFYTGFSVPYLINSKFFDDQHIQLSDAGSRRYYFFIIARIFELNSRFKIKPETLIRFQEGAPLGVDLNLKGILDNKIGLGVIYRSGDALITTFEFQLNENLRLGYAYEWTLSALNKFSRGSHEIMLNYKIKIPGITKYSVCPTYF